VFYKIILGESFRKIQYLPGSPVEQLTIGFPRKRQIVSPVILIAMDQTGHHQEINEKKILTIGGIIIVIVIALISYFEWRGRTGS